MINDYFDDSFPNYLENVPDDHDKYNEMKALQLEKLEVIKRVFPKLSKRQQDVVRLYSTRYLTFDQIAKELDLTKSAVQVYFKRAQKTILKAWKEEQDDF